MLSVVDSKRNFNNASHEGATTSGLRGFFIMTKHRLSTHHLYPIWYRMINRCSNSKDDKYKYYGYRGISICNEWLNDFKSYYDYVISLPNYGKKGFSLDRINNDGDYKPGNMRWADAHIQAVNKNIQRRNNTGYIGVSLPKNNNRYAAQIVVHKKQIYLGTFKTPEQAVKARNDYIIANNIPEYPIQTINNQY